MKPNAYDYHLPQDLIAHAPAEPRDAARLMVYSTATDEIVIDTFAALARYLPASSLIVLNDTRVVPARLQLMKLSGGAVRILFLLNEWNGGAEIKGLPDRKVTVGDSLFFDHRPIAQAVSQHEEEFSFRLLIPPQEFSRLCDAAGRTPLPPYIHSTLDEGQARERYQTVFASKPASVAAPTAALHFTDRVFRSLEAKGIEKAYVTLHVGRGTFSPVTEDMVRRGALHSEPIEVSGDAASAIMRAKAAQRPIVAAGTTAMRTLESSADAILAGKPYAGDTSLMIAPPYAFRVADSLLTNFHLPNTSLLMLLDAFLQSKSARRSWRDLYERAVAERMRFYSFGDAMLIL